ncbi:hypothetical protein M427DRAFT_382850 [Gonapodya prolifera JEL478]|uniref:Uncharacterized protein n=1 Tax=Gonapodya prolifera (strain JEL478) TaxID=1344416 RepID=A0A139A984_GONPJ|nr:hypothetical protein M427DRAFT_382850 [Gonapodya prolifera JEL478]|eukprot:KXS13326.1 hypothetical protein M427DRAFT_382850 [Gonapodya prolifera JEL478]
MPSHKNASLDSISGQHVPSMLQATETGPLPRSSKRLRQLDDLSSNVVEDNKQNSDTTNVKRPRTGKEALPGSRSPFDGGDHSRQPSPATDPDSVVEGYGGLSNSSKIVDSRASTPAGSVDQSRRTSPNLSPDVLGLPALDQRKLELLEARILGRAVQSTTSVPVTGLRVPLSPRSDQISPQSHLITTPSKRNGTRSASPSSSKSAGRSKSSRGGQTPHRKTPKSYQSPMFAASPLYEGALVVGTPTQSARPSFNVLMSPCPSTSARPPSTSTSSRTDERQNQLNSQSGHVRLPTMSFEGMETHSDDRRTSTSRQSTSIQHEKAHSEFEPFFVPATLQPPEDHGQGPFGAGRGADADAEQSAYEMVEKSPFARGRKLRFTADDMGPSVPLEMNRDGRNPDETSDFGELLCHMTAHHIFSVLNVRPQTRSWK